MAQTKTKKEFSSSIDFVVHGILEKKGLRLVKIDMSSIPNSVARHFVICHGTSKTHVDAIADSVIETVKKNLGEDPWHKEGFENSEWILIDYADVVVHIFQETTRQFYKLEELWADAEFQYINNDGFNL